MQLEQYLDDYVLFFDASLFTFGFVHRKYMADPGLSQSEPKW